MNTDKELLELAAKAAGIELKPMEMNNVEEIGDYRFIGFLTDPDQWARGWFNPLTDDGDALRLAVKLKLGIGVEFDRIDAYNSQVHVAEYIYNKPQTDPYAATRRAIVRAAAAIGKEMKP